jgi:gas vesicle protein
MARWSRFRNFGFDDVLGTVGLHRAGHMSGVGTFFIGLGLGLVAGSAASMLLTPFRGTEARERLMRAGEGLGRTVSGKVGEISRQMQQGGRGIESGTSVSTSSSYGTRIGT